MKRIVGLIIFLLCSLATPVLIFGPFALEMQSQWARQLVFWAAALVGGVALRLYIGEGKVNPLLDRWWKCIFVAALLETSIYVAISLLPEISTYPLTIGWSETSRYYNASLFFSERIYGIRTPPTVLHPSRYLMQAVPFLFPGSPLWLHRAWQVFLWLAAPLLTALILARRLLGWKQLETWLIAGVAFVYLTIGPVYYHLLVPVMLILWGFRTGPADSHLSVRATRWRMVLSTLALLVASAWAGISRVNWFPVPGMLAAALILLERPINPAADQPDGSRSKIHWRLIGVYALRLAGWVLLGTATALATQVLYIRWSGNEASQFTTSFTSDLLWHRLLPNPSYPPGLLPAIFIVSLPVMLVVLGKLLELQSGVALWKRVHWLRWLGLAGELFVLFVGGVIVSVKIGGGSNLHNLDAYLILLLIIGVYFYLDRVKDDFPAPVAGETPQPRTRGLSPRALVNAGAILIVIVSAFFTVLSRTPPSTLPDPALVQQGLEKITAYAQKVSQEGGQVLFLTDRHLLTFGMISDVPLVPEYERVFLMEAAMADDPIYLGRLKKDLENRRFGLIISEPLSVLYKKPHDDFGAENNAWVRRVSRFVLCYYEPVETLREVQMQVLVPRSEVSENCAGK